MSVFHETTFMTFSVWFCQKICPLQKHIEFSHGEAKISHISHRTLHMSRTLNEIDAVSAVGHFQGLLQLCLEVLCLDRCVFSLKLNGWSLLITFHKLFLSVNKKKWWHILGWLAVKVLFCDFCCHCFILPFALVSQMFTEIRSSVPVQQVGFF